MKGLRWIRVELDVQEGIQPGLGDIVPFPQTRRRSVGIDEFAVGCHGKYLLVVTMLRDGFLRYHDLAGLILLREAKDLLEIMVAGNGDINLQQHPIARVWVAPFRHGSL
jgi:hypothetical protein